MGAYFKKEQKAKQFQCRSAPHPGACSLSFGKRNAEALIDAARVAAAPGQAGHATRPPPPCRDGTQATGPPVWKTPPGEKSEDPPCCPHTCADGTRFPGGASARMGPSLESRISRGVVPTGRVTSDRPRAVDRGNQEAVESLEGGRWVARFAGDGAQVGQVVLVPGSRNPRDCPQGGGSGGRTISRLMRVIQVTARQSSSGATLRRSKSITLSGSARMGRVVVAVATQGMQRC